jgi:hypothetical protein
MPRIALMSSVTNGGNIEFSLGGRLTVRRAWQKTQCVPLQVRTLGNDFSEPSHFWRRAIDVTGHSGRIIYSLRGGVSIKAAQTASAE